MTKQQGWVAVHRQIQSHWLWSDKPFSKGQAWLDLILLANYEDKKMPYKGEIILCERGTVNMSILSLSERWGWSRKKTKAFLSLLESDGMVTVKATKHRTTIVLSNYDLFNDLGTEKGATKGTTKSLENTGVIGNQGTTKVATKEQQGNNQGTTREQPRNITNNINNINNYNNINKKRSKVDYAPILEAITDDSLKELYHEYIDMRKFIKAPMTERALSMLISKVNELEPNSIDRQKEMLRNAIINNWKSVYPLKDKPQNDKRESYFGDESDNEIMELMQGGGNGGF